MKLPSHPNIKESLTRIAKEYPPGLIELQLSEIDRYAFQVSLILGLVAPGSTICDIGGGICPFSIGCAAFGMDVYLVDDFNDPINIKSGNDVLNVHRRYGVEVIERDVVKEGLEFADEFFDVVTVIATMEHWHNSPKKLFHQVRKMLKNGGFFVLGGPNCVNLRKRLTVPFGHGKWTRMEDWYEEAVFRGHVREPDVDDLRYIARDLGLTDVRVLGRNSLGYINRSAAIRLITPLVDRLLRPFPSLCSDIYLIGRKSG